MACAERYKFTALNLLVLFLYVRAKCPDGCRCFDMNLDCEGVGLRSLPIDVNETVEIFNFDHNSIDTIPQLSSSYRNAKTFRIRSNKLTIIKDFAFRNNSRLQNLFLSSNILTSVKKNTFVGLNQVEILDISHNKLTTLPSHTFCPHDLKKLQSVDLEDNLISSIAEDAFGANSSIKELRLSKNRLHAIPTRLFNNTPSLQRLELNKNDLGNIPKRAFQPLLDLRYLNLDSCEIAFVYDTSFAQLRMLEELRFGRNALRYIPKGCFAGFHGSLKRIRLEFNQLETLDSAHLNLDLLDEVHLDHNPWRCNCSIRWMQSIPISKENNNITCASPSTFKGRLLRNLTSGELQCSSRPSRRISLILAVAIPIIVGLLVILLVCIYCLIKRRQKNDERKAHRYSAVYKDTVERRPQRDGDRLARPVSEL